MKMNSLETIIYVEFTEMRINNVEMIDSRNTRIILTKLKKRRQELVFLQQYLPKFIENLENRSLEADH